MSAYIPGMRVEIRDAEWRIRRVDRTSDGGYLLDCIGLSELIRGKNGQFLSRLEQDVRVLDPVTTELVDDLSADYRASQLFIGTALRQTPPTDDRVTLGHEGAMDVLPFQLDPVRQALQQPRQRILIADSVGLGKTLEAGILTSELIRRGRGKRILVLATKSMLGQFQMEFWQRFTIPLTRLDSVGLQRVRNQIPTNHNPFHYFDRAIISIDTLKQTLEYRHYLEQAYWDIIIIDEAHNVAKRSNNSQRYQLAKLLSTRSDTMIMLSATPHDGKAESFASLVDILDPTAIVNWKDYSHEDFSERGLVVRRFKHEVADQLSAAFPAREISTAKIRATDPEEEAFDLVANAEFKTLDGTKRRGGALFRTTLEKALFSSPCACLSTVENRLKMLAKKEQDGDVLEDIDTLDGIALALRAISPDQFSKYQLLTKMLDKSGPSSLGWTRATDDRLVVFTESLVTLAFLKEHLERDLKLKKGELEVLTGTMKDTDLADIVEQFGKSDSKIRLLLCSDVASEGINLHHLSHRMVHFDIPWSLMVFQQRNGRIDRYGQTKQPQIRYLMTESSNSDVRGDQRVLEVLIEKDSQAGKNIGDPSEFMGLYDQQEEEERVAAAMEADTNTGDFGSLIDDLLFGDVQTQAEDALKPYLPKKKVSNHADLEAITAPSPKLYRDDYSFAKEALNWLKSSGERVDFKLDDAKQQIDLTAPRDLQQQSKFLPREVRPSDYRFILTTDKSAVQHSVKMMRDAVDAQLAGLHYLWQLHPVMEWLQSRVQDAFGRHTAPVVRLPSKLAEGEHWFVLQGGFPNKRGQALIQQTLAVQVSDGQVASILPAMDFLKQYKLDGSAIPNRGIEGDVHSLRDFLPVVVDRANASLKAARDQLEAVRGEQLTVRLQQLSELRARHITQLEMELEQSNQVETFKKRKEHERREQINRVFEEYKHWIEETQRTEPEPYIQVIAVLTGNTH